MLIWHRTYRQSKYVYIILSYQLVGWRRILFLHCSLLLFVEPTGWQIRSWVRIHLKISVKRSKDVLL